MARNPRTLLRELIDQAARNENCVDALRAVVDEYSSDEGGEKGPGPDLLAALSSTLEGLPLSSLCSVKPLSRSVLKLLRLGAIFVPDFVKRLLVDMPSLRRLCAADAVEAELAVHRLQLVGLFAQRPSCPSGCRRAGPPPAQGRAPCRPCAGRGAPLAQSPVASCPLGAARR